MPGKDKGFKKQSTKQLQTMGKRKFFEAIEEYVDAKIDLRTLLIRPSLPQEQVEERASKATEKLMAMLDAISIQLEM